MAECADEETQSVWLRLLVRRKGENETFIEGKQNVLFSLCSNILLSFRRQQEQYFRFENALCSRCLRRPIDESKSATLPRKFE